MSYVSEYDIRLKSYDHSNLLRASVVQFRASRWVMSANRTSVWKVMPIGLCRELPLFNVELLDELCLRIGHPVKSVDHLNFSSASIVQFQASRYFKSPNRSSMWKVMTIQISCVLPLCIFERPDILCSPIQTSVWKVMTIRILESFRCSISSV